MLYFMVHSRMEVASIAEANIISALIAILIASMKHQKRLFIVFIHMNVSSITLKGE